MLVACCDQNEGISTSRCSNTTSPRSLPMTADRWSHVTSSNGSTPGNVKKRGNSSPGDGDAELPVVPHPARGFLAVGCSIPVIS